MIARVLLPSICLWISGLLALADQPRVGKDFWAFQPPQTSPLPESAIPAQHRIDRFLLEALESHDLSPQGTASDSVFHRRAHVLLTGLPPTPHDQARFEADTSPNKRQRLIDRLLGSYAFGERLASFWLPIARYAEDQAHEVGNNKSLTYPNAHRYRQWVIDAFNRDLSYPQFVRFQLAADLHDDGKAERDALGFLGLGPKYYNRGRLEVMADEWEDRVDTVTRTFMGLTVACARCHDHKYDPISARDYHALASIFASTEMVNEVLPGQEAPKDKDGKPNKQAAPVHTRHIVKDGNPRDLPVFIRGNVERKGEAAPRGFLSILSEIAPTGFDQGSGRKPLAEALVSPRNPLAARVMVNRLWREVFGHGLVQTPSNFGALGQAPSHPRLLDELALDFQGHGSIKRLLRSLLETQAFHRVSTAGATLLEQDPKNLWYGRMTRHRLSFEMWRDTVLHASGDLDPRGGASMEIEDEENHRRTVYARVSRLDLNDVLEAFDYPDPNIHAAGRVATTTTTQKLFLLNHPFVLDQASRIAERAHASGDDPVAWLYRQLLARAPQPHERRRAQQFLKAGKDRLPGLVQVLLCSNEMLYLD